MKMKKNTLFGLWYAGDSPDRIKDQKYQIFKNESWKLF